jgi:hypothetical protein
MAVMAKRRPPKGNDPPDRPPSPRPGTPIFFYTSDELRAALGVLLARNRRSLTAEMNLALEAHLKAAGLWPPPAPPEGEGEGE